MSPAQPYLAESPAKVTRASAASPAAICPPESTSSSVEPCVWSLRGSDVCFSCFLYHAPGLLVNEPYLHLLHPMETGSWASRGHFRDQFLKLGYYSPAWGLKSHSCPLLHKGSKSNNSSEPLRVSSYFEMAIAGKELDWWSPNSITGCFSGKPVLWGTCLVWSLRSLLVCTPFGVHVGAFVGSSKSTRARLSGILIHPWSTIFCHILSRHHTLMR